MQRELDEGSLPRTTLIVKGLPFHSNEASLAEALGALGVAVVDCRYARARTPCAWPSHRDLNHRARFGQS